MDFCGDILSGTPPESPVSLSVLSSHYKPDIEFGAGNAILNQQRGDLRDFRDKSGTQTFTKSSITSGI